MLRSRTDSASPLIIIIVIVELNPLLSSDPETFVVTVSLFQGSSPVYIIHLPSFLLRYLLALLVVYTTELLYSYQLEIPSL